MKRFAYSSLLLAALVTAMVVSGCAGFGPSSQVLPSSAGSAITLEQLRADMDDYQVVQSGPVFNPSSLLFLLRQSDSEVKLTGQWSRVKSDKELNDRLKRMRELRDPNIKLWALLAPTQSPDRDRKLLGYIYTAGTASVRQGDSPGTYVVRAVPERFNPRYYGDDDNFGGSLER